MSLLASLQNANRDTWLLLSSRFIRLFAYGALPVVLVFHLVEVALTEPRAGLLLTLTLLGDTVVSLALTTHADRFGSRAHADRRRRPHGRRRTGVCGHESVLAPPPRRNRRRGEPERPEVGPFLPIEQAPLSRMVSAGQRTRVFGWFTLVGALATACGSLAAGYVAPALQWRGDSSLTSYRGVVMLCAALGVVLAGVFYQLTGEVEAPSSWSTVERRGRLGSLSGLPHSRSIVGKLFALFALDAFGGGFASQNLAAYWFHLRFGAEPAVLGPIFVGANCAFHPS